MMLGENNNHHSKTSHHTHSGSHNGSSTSQSQLSRHHSKLDPRELQVFNQSAGPIKVHDKHFECRTDIGMTSEQYQQWIWK